MTDIVLEAVRAAVLFGIFLFLWKSGDNRFQQFRKGWNLILIGFGLLLFGSLLDISDNFESLNAYVIIGDTEVEAFLEKFVGFLGGFAFLAVGLFKWIPGVQGLSDQVEKRTEELQKANDNLVLEMTKREKAEQIKHDFTATVSHELRTPLTSIMGALGLVKAGTLGKLPGKVQSTLDIAYQNSERLTLLINDILDMEKINSGKMVFHKSPTGVIKLVEEALEVNQGYGDTYGVTFAKAPALEDALVMVDKNRMIQALSNLMSNAAKFSPRGEKIIISTVSSGDEVKIAVKDSGLGIPDEYKDSIFESFTQVDSTDTRQKNGTGLGLSITKGIVEHHGGKIGLVSELGIGSTFYFILPIVKHQS